MGWNHQPDIEYSLLKMTIEIVELPINSMVIFPSYVSLPESIAKSYKSSKSFNQDVASPINYFYGHFQ